MTRGKFLNTKKSVQICLQKEKHISTTNSLITYGLTLVDNKQQKDDKKFIMLYLQMHMIYKVNITITNLYIVVGYIFSS